MQTARQGREANLDREEQGRGNSTKVECFCGHFNHTCNSKGDDEVIGQG